MHEGMRILTEAELKLTVGAMVTARLGGRAEYADRVLLGPIELIVRDVDDKGKITGLGLSFEPTAPVARVPVFLSAGEIGDRRGARSGVITSGIHYFRQLGTGAVSPEKRHSTAGDGGSEAAYACGRDRSIGCPRPGDQRVFQDLPG